MGYKEYYMNMVWFKPTVGAKFLAVSQSFEECKLTKEQAMEEIADGLLDGEYVHTVHISGSDAEVLNIEEEAKAWWESELEEAENDRVDKLDTVDYLNQARLAPHGGCNE